MMMFLATDLCPGSPTPRPYRMTRTRPFTATCPIFVNDTSTNQWVRPSNRRTYTQAPFQHLPMMMRMAASNLYSTDGRNVEEDGRSRETSTNQWVRPSNRRTCCTPTPFQHLPMMMRMATSNLYSTDGRNVDEDGRSHETRTNVLPKNPKDTL